MSILSLFTKPKPKPKPNTPPTNNLATLLAPNACAWLEDLLNQALDLRRVETRVSHLERKLSSLTWLAEMSCADAQQLSDLARSEAELKRLKEKYPLLRRMGLDLEVVDPAEDKYQYKSECESVDDDARMNPLWCFLDFLTTECLGHCELECTCMRTGTWESDDHHNHHMEKKKRKASIGKMSDMLWKAYLRGYVPVKEVHDILDYL